MLFKDIVHKILERAEGRMLRELIYKNGVVVWIWGWEEERFTVRYNKRQIWIWRENSEEAEEPVEIGLIIFHEYDRLKKQFAMEEYYELKSGKMVYRKTRPKNLLDITLEVTDDGSLVIKFLKSKGRPKERRISLSAF